MRKLILALSLLLATGTVVTINSCKKAAATEDDSVSAQDAAIISDGINSTSGDAGAAAGQVQSFTGKTSGLYAALCGTTTVDTSTANQITITFDNSNYCYGIKRSGSITVTLTSGTHWQDVGAQLTVTYNNVKVTDEALPGSTFTLNGSHTITNELGGLAWKIAYGLTTNDSCKHRNASSNMMVTFPDGSQRTWAFDRTIEWASVDVGGANVITQTIYSEATGGVDVTGINRYGNGFTNTILVPVVSDNNSRCLYFPYLGKIQHQIGTRTATIAYGTNASGVPDGSPATCPEGFYISYTNSATGVATGRAVSYW